MLIVCLNSTESVYFEVLNMLQVSLYLDQEVLDTAKHNARIERISLSRYVAKALVKNNEAGWPQGYWDLFGAMTDATFVRPDDIPFSEVANSMEFS